jgi:hypothetical protein
VGIPWEQFTVSGGGWILAFWTVCLVVGSFVLGRLYSRSQVLEMLKPRDDTIAAQREEIKDLKEQKDTLQHEILANQTQFFKEITEAKTQVAK